MNNKPKLCYVIPYYHKDDATHFSHVFDFIQAIADHFELWVLIERGTLPDREICKNFKVVLSSGTLPFFRFVNIFWLLLSARLSGWRNFYVHYSFGGALLVSCIVRVCGGRVYYWNCGEPWKYKRNFFRELFERLVYRMVDYVVTGTVMLGEQYAAHYGISQKKIRTMPNWISHERFRADISEREALRHKLHIPDDSRIVLFAHRLSQRKGAQYILDIVSAFGREPVYFVVVGEGPERQSLELRAQSSEFGDKIKFVGAVPNHRMPLYFSLADAFILPSDEEGFPRVLLEAMAMQVPYVAFAVGGVLEITPPMLRSYVVVSADTDAFIQKLKTILTLSSDEYKAIQAEEKNWVLQFDIHAVVRRFRYLFNE